VALSTPRVLLCCATFVVALVFLFHNFPSYPNPFASKMSSSWRDYAKIHPAPSSWEPKESDLAFAVIRDGPGPQDDTPLTLAVFGKESSDKVAVDAMGAVLTLKQDDFDKFITLAEKTTKPDFPQADSWRNTWSIFQQRTSQPIDRLIVPVPDGEKPYKETAVQGYSANQKKLQEGIGKMIDAEIPDNLHELFGLIAPARSDFDRSKRDAETLSRVVSVIKNKMPGVGSFASVLSLYSYFPSGDSLGM
jgi:hypothetical protein